MKIIRSKYCQTQEVSDINQKEAGELKGFSILWMAKTTDVFQVEEKKCKDQEKLKM